MEKAGFGKSGGIFLSVFLLVILGVFSWHWTTGGCVLLRGTASPGDSTCTRLRVGLDCNHHGMRALSNPVGQLNPHPCYSH